MTVNAALIPINHLSDDQVELVAPHESTHSVPVSENLLEIRTKLEELPRPPSLLEMLHFGSIDKAVLTDDLAASLKSPEDLGRLKTASAPAPARLDGETTAYSSSPPSSTSQVGSTAGKKGATRRCGPGRPCVDYTDEQVVRIVDADQSHKLQSGVCTEHVREPTGALDIQRTL